MHPDDAAATAAALWELGDLAWKLDAHQELIYAHYRNWERRRLTEKPTGAHRVYMLDAGRRVGKTFSTALIRLEDALVHKNETFLIACATEKQLKELVLPVLQSMIADAPDHMRPRFFTSRWGMRAGYFIPSSDSVLKLVGIDKNPDGLRGPALGGANITEAAFVRQLAYCSSSVVYPQFQRRRAATLLLESSAPKDADHDFDRIFKPDCESRGAYFFMTIDDNTAISQEQKDEFVAAARAIDPDDAEREYYGKRTRNRQRVVVPEFDDARHVRALERPRYAQAIVAMDPGMRDLFALLWAYWDADRAQLVIERDWCQRNASTSVVAEVITETERELYGDCASQRGFGVKRPDGLCYWDGGEFRGNPYMRVSDTDARLIGDLVNDYGILVSATMKDDKEAALFSLRAAFRAKKIVVHPRCAATVAHINAARWNEQRTDYERSAVHGHYDLLDALVYAWRMCAPMRAANPMPPAFRDRNDVNVLFSGGHAGMPEEERVISDAFAGDCRRGGWR